MRLTGWCTTLVHQHGGQKTNAQIKPNFNQNSQIFKFKDADIELEFWFDGPGRHVPCKPGGERL